MRRGQGQLTYKQQKDYIKKLRKENGRLRSLIDAEIKKKESKIK